MKTFAHAATAATSCPSLNGKQLHPHVLRHSCAMALLHARVDTAVIVTDNGTLPPARYVITLDATPLGMAPTSTMPAATSP